MINFLAHTDEDRKEMLKSISLDKVEDFFQNIPDSARIKEFNLSDAMSEMQVQREIKSISKKNKTDLITFLGAGVYNKFIPASIAQVAQRFEFLTAYTPYQPEISQGTLQVMYEFQSMICNLTGMEVSNASVYDAASACAESILMAARITKKYKALVSKSLNPQYLDVVKTYADFIGIEIVLLESDGLQTDYNAAKKLIDSGEFACILIQTPNFYGEIEDFDEQLIISSGTLLCVCTEPSSLAVLTPPSGYGADIVVGDIQTLGIPMSFGGPHGGFMACKEKYMRQLPGRIAGRTLDKDGNQAFTLTIQTREQHIKREKATSNICSNQALMALCATLYLSLLGEKGFVQSACLSAQNAHNLAQMLVNKGYKVLNTNFYNEFVVEVNDAKEFLQKLKAIGIIGGLAISENQVLVALTEMNSEEDLQKYCSVI